MFAPCSGDDDPSAVSALAKAIPIALLVCAGCSNVGQAPQGAISTTGAEAWWCLTLLFAPWSGTSACVRVQTMMTTMRKMTCATSSWPLHTMMTMRTMSKMTCATSSWPLHAPAVGCSRPHCAPAFGCYGHDEQRCLAQMMTTMTMSKMTCATSSWPLHVPALEGHHEEIHHSSHY